MEDGVFFPELCVHIWCAFFPPTRLDKFKFSGFLFGAAALALWMPPCMLEYSQFRTPKKLRIATEGESRKKKIKKRRIRRLIFQPNTRAFLGLNDVWTAFVHLLFPYWLVPCRSLLLQSFEPLFLSCTEKNFQGVMQYQSIEELFQSTKFVSSFSRLHISTLHMIPNRTVHIEWIYRFTIRF